MRDCDNMKALKPLSLIAADLPFLQYLRKAWRRRWMGVTIAWLVCCAGWAGVYAIPNQFESSARLYVDADAVLTPLLRGIAADSAAMTQLEFIQRTLLSRPNLEKLISKSGLDLTLRRPSDRDRLLTRLVSDIRIVPQTNNLFTITYRNENAQLAHDVVQTLLTIFVEGTTGGSRDDMENANRFLERQIQSYEQQLHAAEQRRAEFRARYIEILPATDNPNVPALESVRASALELEGRLQDAIASRDALNTVLQTTPPMLVTDTGGPLGTVNGQPVKSKLQLAQEELRILRLKYTEAHPDVVAQRKLIESLMSAPRDPAAPAATAGRDPAASGMTHSVPNPMYEQLKVRLIDADSAIASLRRQHSDAVSYRDRLEKVQREQPGLIAEYQNMDRDYNVLRRSHEELLARLQSTNVALAAGVQADNFKLRVIDPPKVPNLPASPNRLLLVTIVLLGGMAGGAGITVLLGQFDRSFSTVHDLQSLGFPVLGGISLLVRVPIRRQLMAAVRFSAAVAMLVCTYGGIVVYILRSAA
jgi:polysaccharide chain length determinant protein (PEP-CTERM system associated)